MSIMSYKLLLAIAEQKSMVKAAALMHITPSAATHAMNVLEGKVGFPLINRNKSGVTLTNNGKILLPKIKALLAEEELLQKEIQKIERLENGSVRLGVFDSVCTLYLPEILKSFRGKYPNINVNVYQSGYAEIAEKLAGGELDVGFLSLPIQGRFRSVTLTHDRLLCIMPADFQTENEAFVTANDLRKLPIVMSRCGVEKSIVEFLSQNSLRPSSEYTIFQDTSVISLVEHGLCFSILAEMVLKCHPGNYKALPLDSNKYRTIVLATPSDSETSGAARKLIDEIRAFMQDN